MVVAAVDHHARAAEAGGLHQSHAAERERGPRHGPGSPAIATLDDLSGQEVFVRKTSSYHASLQALNATLQAKGKPPVTVHEAPESLEDDDLMEMVNAGLIPATVVDDYLAEYWKQVFTDMTVHAALTVRTGGEPGGRHPEEQPEARRRAERVHREERHGVRDRQDPRASATWRARRFVKNATSEAERKKFLAMVDLFRKYGDQYKLDYLLMAAQGYQESRLDQDAKSQVGAIGVMQLMPETGRSRRSATSRSSSRTSTPA